MKAANLHKQTFALVAALLILLPGLADAAADPLEAGFTQPPDEAEPWALWHWMNGHITWEGITADLEAMADAITLHSPATVKP